MSNRFDWSPHTSRFIVRMPTATHEIFTAYVVEEIWSQLKNIARENTDIAPILDLIVKDACTDIHLYGHKPINKRYPQHSPDASFAHAKSQYPSIVIETSYSQKKKLVVLADEYILGSDGNISIVLGFDIEYGIGSKKASLSIWRPRLMQNSEEEGSYVLETFSIWEAKVIFSQPSIHHFNSTLVEC